MRQTHLLKLDAPYRIVWDEDKLRMCKHMATLIEVCEEEDGSISTREHIVNEEGAVWYNGTIEDCKEICREHESIKLTDFLHILMLAPQRKWFPNGQFDIYYLAYELRYFEVNVEFPGEKEANGKEMVIPTMLFLGKSERGDYYWVENGHDDFYIAGSKQTKKELEAFIIYMRNEYYRAFPDKNFRIEFTTEDKDWQEMIDRINANTHIA